jgi:hypothetical protein
MDEGLLAGVFSTREQAEAAVIGLRRKGLTEDVEVRTPLPGRYRLENRASQEIARAVVIGIASGALGGALGGMKLLPTLVPAVSDAGLAGILLGVLIGAFWGAFYGGVFALGQKVLSRVDEDRWWMISAGGNETLVLVRPGARLGAARKVMRRFGTQFFLAQIPAAEPAEAAPRAA